MNEVSRDAIERDLVQLHLTAAQFRGTLLDVFRTIKRNPELGPQMQETVQNLRLGIGHLEKGIEALNAKLALPNQPA